MNRLNSLSGSGIGSGTGYYGHSTVLNLSIHGEISQPEVGRVLRFGDGYQKEGIASRVESLFFSGTSRLMLECGARRRVMEAVSLSFSNALVIVMIQNNSIFDGSLALSNLFELFHFQLLEYCLLKMRIWVFFPTATEICLFQMEIPNSYFKLCDLRTRVI
jgi:hypothetical protein